MNEVTNKVAVESPQDHWFGIAVVTAAGLAYSFFRQGDVPLSYRVGGAVVYFAMFAIASGFIALMWKLFTGRWRTAFVASFWVLMALSLLGELSGK